GRGRVFGQNDLKGAGTVDATVTGNGQNLNASGMLDGASLGVVENTALDLDSMFDVTLPALKPADAIVHAKTNATFLKVGGQEVNELTADTTYTQQKLDFDATAKQGVRQLTAAGSAVLHTDHREVHIGSLALQSENAVWNADPASQ